MYDIVVVGAGPSGSVFSKFISQKYKVLVIDRRDYENKSNGIVKSCGGLLTDEAQAMLSSLGYVISKEVLVSPQVFDVKVLDYDNNLRKKYYKGYLNIDREAFDNYLLSKKSSHVEVIKDALVVDYSENNNELINLKYKKNGEEFSVETKLVIAADGANSLFRKRLDKDHPETKHIAIQRIYELKEELPYHIALFDKEINNYYSWAIPKENKLIVGTVLEKNTDVWDKFARLEKLIKNEGIDISNYLKQEGCFIERPNHNEYFIKDKNIIFIGEAAGFISPSSSEGISFALKSGYYLADSLNKKGLIEGVNLYEKKAKKIKNSLNLKILKSKIMYTPIIRNIIVRIGIFANKEYVKS